MARKFCPACNYMNGGSAVRCSQCDHEFDPSTIVAPGPLRSQPRKCPQCQTENPRLLERCACGHTFADVSELREQLVDRARTGTSYIVLGALGIAASVAIAIASSATLLVMFPGFAVLIAKGARMRSAARQALAQIPGSPTATLPAAKVVR